jgi:CRP/FNR family transcriptional regulator, cyclic AMP receptor protein
MIAGMARVQDARLEHLREVPLFAACTEEQLAHVVRASREIEVPAQTTLYRHGDAGSEFYLVLTGEAMVKRYGRKIATLGPGGCFGELALLTGARRNATVVVTADSTLLVLSQPEFDELLDTVPRLAHKLLAALAQRLADADEKAFTR